MGSSRLTCVYVCVLCCLFIRCSIGCVHVHSTQTMELQQWRYGEFSVSPLLQTWRLLSQHRANSAVHDSCACGRFCKGVSRVFRARVAPCSEYHRATSAATAPFTLVLIVSVSSHNCMVARLRFYFLSVQSRCHPCAVYCHTHAEKRNY